MDHVRRIMLYCFVHLQNIVTAVLYGKDTMQIKGEVDSLVQGGYGWISTVVVHVYRRGRLSYGIGPRGAGASFG